MTINGTEHKLTNPSKLTHILEERNCIIDRVAVELNGEIVPKSEFQNTTITDGDRLEIVSFVGGG